MSFASWLRPLLLGLVTLAPACASVSDDASAEGAAITSGSCASLIEDASGEQRDAESVLAHDDLVVKHLLKSAGPCPVTFRDVVGTLSKAGCGKDGMLADVVSERSALLGKPEGGRVVLFPRCNAEGTFATGSEEDAELVLSPPQLMHTEGNVGDSVEIIARDATSGVFNFYAVEGSKWRFFGDSRSMRKGPGSKDQRRCANCHVRGGLVMKELATPWMNWDHAHAAAGRQPGIDAVRANIAKNLNLSSLDAFSNPRSRFFALELTVTKANQALNGVRIADALKGGTLGALLEPVLCDKEINLENEFSPAFLLNEPTGVPFHVSPAVLAQAAAAAGQSMKDDDGKAVIAFKHDEKGTLLDEGGAPLKGADDEPLVLTERGDLVDAEGVVVKDKKVATAPATDTVQPFFHAVRARIEADYAAKLVERGLVSDKLIRALRRVDAVRPVLSDERCGLVASMPNVPLGSADLAKKIDEAVVAELDRKANRSAVEEELLRNLRETDDVGAGRVAAFFKACADRSVNEPDGFANDVTKVLSAQRDAIRQRPIAESAELLPFDELHVASTVRFDLSDCKVH